MSALAPTLQAFFTDRLIRERNASPHTIAAYRDTIRLLLAFASERLAHRAVEARDRPSSTRRLIGAFLDHLERDRGCAPGPATRRLTAIRSLLPLLQRCATQSTPPTIERVLAIPPKRHDRALVTFLTEPEIDALIDAPDRSTWTGRRDHAMIMLLAQTGLRASELTGLACGDIHLGIGAHVATTGKGGLCRIRHRPPYVAPGTMLRSRLWWQARAGDRGLSAEHSLGWVRDSPGTREGCRAAGSGRAWRWSARCGQARVV